MCARKAVFFDRDGTINKVIFRNGFKNPMAPFSFAELHIFEDAKDVLNILKDLGFLCVLVTNQPDVGYGHLTYEEWRNIQNEIEKLDFDGVFICRHTRNQNCECKKPKPGMLLDAKENLDIDLSRSFMVGDTENDMKAGRAAGCSTIMIRAFYNAGVRSDFVVKDLLEAANLICRLDLERGIK